MSSDHSAVCLTILLKSLHLDVDLLKEEVIAD